MTSQCSIWIDVEDVFDYFEDNYRPSGIQRVVIEILRVIRQRADQRPSAMAVRLVKRAQDGTALVPVQFDELFRLFDSRTELGAVGADEKSRALPQSKPIKPTVSDQVSPWRRLRRSAIRRLQTAPPDIGEPLLTIAISQMNTARLLRSYLKQRTKHRGKVPPVADIPAETTPLATIDPQRVEPEPVRFHQSDTEPKAGDIFLILGAAWTERGFGERLSTLRTKYGIEPILLVYDLIPALRPEWCARVLIDEFRHWLNSTLPQCRRLLAISQATALSVETYARRNGLDLVAPVRAIPIGSGFGERSPIISMPDARSSGLPPRRSYVLFVSTIEARKNHMLAFLVWQRLLAELPMQEVPTLVFAGREGWLVADLMQQIENTDWLRGKLRLLRDPTDAELSQLYEGCLFTLFPSLFEGWGLPVTESLMNGAPCIASNSTSIPEAGGKLTRYFDPEDVDDAYRVIRDALRDPEDIERWRAEVRRDFEPVAWHATADAILEACEQSHADGVA